MSIERNIGLYMEFASIEEIDFSGHKVLVRVDFNVPLSEAGEITDDSRIREALPTLQHLIDKGAALIIMSHLGRPKGKKEPKYSLAPVAKALAIMLDRPVTLAPDVIGKDVQALADKLKPGDILLLENIRFHPEEENPTEEASFARELAKLGTFYVNDAFGTAHRKHTSTFHLAKHFPGKTAAGFLMTKEMKILTKVFEQPDRPFSAVIGGAKIDSKLGIIESLLEKANDLFIGGAMAFTFLKAQGYSVGKSLVDESHLDTAKHLISLCKEKQKNLFLPEDVVIAKEIKENAPHEIVTIQEGIPESHIGLDIGQKTIASWKETLAKAKTVFWNGPMGVFEIPPFQNGTLEIAKILATLQAITVIGGGDSAAAIHALGFAKQFTHISTGGGASLEFIEKGKLHAIDALKN